MIAQLLLLFSLATLPHSSAIVPRDALRFEAQPGGSRAFNRHLDALLRDVDTLRRPGGALPGNLIAFEDKAFIIASGERKDSRLGVIGAAVYGRGRVVAFGHNGFLGDWDLQDEGGTFLENAVLWTAKRNPKSKRSPRIAIVGGGAPLEKRLGMRFDGVRTYRGFDELDTIVNEHETDVILWAGSNPSEGERETLTEFVRTGGGVLLGVCPWGKQQGMDGRGNNESIRTHLPQNLFLAPMGLVFGAETISDAEYNIDPEQSERLHGGLALETALAWIKTGKATANAKLGAEQAANQVAGLLRALPPGEQAFTPAVERALQAKSFAEHVPGPKRPTARENIIGYFGMLVATDKWNHCDPDDVEAAPGHEHFPGPVPSDAKRADVMLAVETSQIKRGAWISTGYYAPAGEVIQLNAARAKDAKGWSVRIGAHKDRLWHKDKLNRWPEITHQWKLNPEQANPFRVASPFGGLVYLVPGKSAQPTEFRLQGVVEAPFFVLGDPASSLDWKRRRTAPAPWAELACDGVVLTIPAGAVRQLDDPTELMKYWQQVMQCYPELRGEPQPDRPERLVEDIQISAGWMHSGYPVMTHGAENKDHSNAVDLEVLSTEGDWGYFHEFGHNAQKSDWTFAGTGEVTCNLFSLFIGEKMAGIEPWKNPWLKRQHDKPQEHFAKGAPFDEWKQSPGLALMMYATLQREFGWEPFQKALAAYVDAPADERPQTNEEKHDRWMLRMSKATGKNLGPYFQHWGIPTSEKARSQLLHLKSWMPAEY